MEGELFPLLSACAGLPLLQDLSGTWPRSRELSVPRAWDSINWLRREVLLWVFEPAWLIRPQGWRQTWGGGRTPGGKTGDPWTMRGSWVPTPCAVKNLHVIFDSSKLNWASLVALGDGEGQGSLACCSSWGGKSRIQLSD